MKHLILMRHAKSDWSISGLSDFERPLNKRGLKDASNMGKWMAHNVELPQIILCSSARRTQQTQQLALLAIQQEGYKTNTTKQHALDELYHASRNQIKNIINIQFADYDRIMLIAHNPGLDATLTHFCPNINLTQQGKLMTTGSIAVIEFDDILNTRLIAFQRPREL